MISSKHIARTVFVTCILGWHLFASPEKVMAQAGGGPGAYIDSITGTGPEMVDVTYYLDQDYEGYKILPDEPKKVYLRLYMDGAIEVNSFELFGDDKKQGTHTVSVNTQHIQGAFTLFIILDEEFSLQTQQMEPTGIAQSFYFANQTVTEGMSYVWVGMTPVWESPVKPQGDCDSTTSFVDTFSDMYSRVKLNQEVMGIGPGCASCGANGGLTNAGSTLFRHQFDLAIFQSGAGMGGSLAGIDSNGFAYTEDGSSVVVRIVDFTLGNVIVFREGSVKDGILFDEYGIAEKLIIDDTKLENVTTAEMIYRDGSKKIFEVFDASDGDDDSDGDIDKNCRLTSIVDPNGKTTSISYGIDFQILSVTDPLGHTTSFEFERVNGRDRVTKVTHPSGNEVTFAYVGNNVSEIDLGRAGKWTQSVSSNAIAQTTDFTVNDPFHGQTVLSVTQDYIEFSGDLIAQPSNIVRALYDGEGDNVASFFQNPNDASEFLAWYGEDQLSQITVGIGERFYESWTLGDPSQGYNGFILGPVESNFPHNLFTPNTEEEDKVIGIPTSTVGMDGTQVDYEYNASHFPTKASYCDGSYQEWEYDSENRVIRTKTRDGRVEKFVYDASGNIIERHVGILEVAGADVNQPEYGVFKYEYDSNGMVTKMMDPLYSTSAPDLHVTEMTYDTQGRILTRTGSADSAGGTRPTTSYVYDINGRLLTETDPLSRVVTYGYDEVGRHVQTQYNDGSTEQILYGSLGTGQEQLVIKRKNRSGVVTFYEHDAAFRIEKQTVGYSIDSDILDGLPDDTIITDPNQQNITEYEYLVGTSIISRTTRDGRQTDYVHDYRGRVVEQNSYPELGKILTTKTHYKDGRIHYTEDPLGRRTFIGYRCDGQVIRRLMTTVPGINYTLMSDILNETRVGGTNETILISDSLRNADGNLTDVVDARGCRSIFEYDSRGRVVKRTLAEGTSDEAITEFDYNLAGQQVESRYPRYFDASDTRGFQNAKSTTTYTGRGLVEAMSDAPGTSEAASVSMTYTLDGRRETYVDEGNQTWTTLYHPCCGRRQGEKDPYGHGRVFNNDYLGNVTHECFVEDFDSHSDFHNPIDSKTHTEITRRYDVLGRLVADSRWLVPLGTVDPLNPPIAGLDGVAETDGLTTRTIFDNNLADGIGLDSVSGISVDKLGGGTFALSLVDCLTKLSEAPVQGGGSISFVSGAAGHAEVTISGEEYLFVVIYDAAHREVMSASIEPHFGTNPNGLITWNCIQRDAVDEITNYGDCEVASTIDPNGGISKEYYDASARTIKWIDEAGNFGTADYDSNGNVLSWRDADGVGEDCQYDCFDRLILCTDTHGDSYGFTYDLSGNTIAETDAKTNQTTAIYDARDQLVSMTDRENGTRSVARDGHGRITAATDAEGQITRWDYDNRGQLIEIEYPDHVAGSTSGQSGFGKKNVTYDPAGRPSYVTDQTGDSVSLTFDMAGRLEQRDYRTSANSPTGPISDSDSFVLNQDSRIISATTTRYGNTVAFALDEAGRLASESLTIGGQTYTVQRGYDNAGHLDHLIYPSGNVASYTYTTTHQLSTVTWDGSVLDTRTYSPGGRIQSSTYGNSVVTNFSFRNDGIIDQIDVVGVTKHDYQFDENKNLTDDSITGPMNPYGYSVGLSGYDDNDRLVNWNRNDNNLDQSWTLTPEGDWSTVTTNTVPETRTHNDAHETVSIGSNQLLHDLRGNLTQDQDGQILSWDMDSLLSAVDLDGDSTDDVTFTYDAFGRRVSRDDGTTHMVFAMAGHQVVADYTFGTAPTSPIEEYVYGDYIDEPIAKDGTGGLLYYHSDRQYSVNALTDTNGAVVERYAYTAYGEPLILDGAGTTTRSTSSYDNRYMFTGREYDDALGVYFFRNRYYDPEMGRFIGRDPLGYVDGLNLYAGYFAPSGLDPMGTSVLGLIPGITGVGLIEDAIGGIGRATGRGIIRMFGLEDDPWLCACVMGIIEGGIGYIQDAINDAMGILAMANDVIEALPEAPRMVNALRDQAAAFAVKAMRDPAAIGEEIKSSMTEFIDSLSEFTMEEFLEILFPKTMDLYHEVKAYGLGRPYQFCEAATQSAIEIGIEVISIAIGIAASIPTGGAASGATVAGRIAQKLMCVVNKITKFTGLLKKLKRMKLIENHFPIVGEAIEKLIKMIECFPAGTQVLVAIPERDSTLLSTNSPRATNTRVSFVVAFFAGIISLLGFIGSLLYRKRLSQKTSLAVRYATFGCLLISVLQISAFATTQDVSEVNSGLTENKDSISGYVIGSMSIEDIRPGDYVLARPESGGELSARRVSSITWNIADTLVTLEVRKSCGKSSRIKCTPDHMIWSSSREEWISAINLNINEKVKSADGSELVIESSSVERLSANAPVFNLVVESDHTYFVCEQVLLWVHNGCHPKVNQPGNLRGDELPVGWWSPHEVDKRKSDRRDGLGLGKDSDIDIPDLTFNEEGLLVPAKPSAPPKPKKDHKPRHDEGTRKDDGNERPPRGRK